jgi:small subunit ribosomal protein S8
MSYNDIMSDYVARINNSVMVGKEQVVVRKNRLTSSVSKKLVRLGYFSDFDLNDNNLLITLNLEKIKKLRRISTPGHRKYTSFKNFPIISGGIGFYLLTTSQGIKTHVEANQDKIGGELLFSII